MSLIHTKPILVVVAALAVAMPLAAQQASGKITGVVADSTGGVPVVAVVNAAASVAGGPAVRCSVV